ncbi:MAG: NAD-dependent epimerase/dehydratase family protein, partial [Azonexaceae bacterium]|nr:NAD-dependent epimerase/dehydratase family protein [Azonexaceae bacterium]
TGLRFFTVYGPWGRPDMAPFLFAGAILRGEPIKVFNHGDMKRDFTYFDDIVEGVIRVVDKPAAVDAGYDPISADPASSNVPYRVFNIGNSDPVPLMDFIGALESAIGRVAEKIYLPMQDGDVPATYADTALLDAWVGFKPATPIGEGVSRFVAWYRDYYQR